ncbi:diflavin oxidoreductase [Pollutibacter soli]|uniref:diflavin oxidoreductase n=1 Tax=Pollutibacter soli TaxID=3034157 RepID=UPI003013484B
MLPGSKLKILQDLIDSSSKEELIWMNGYLSGLVSRFPEAKSNGLIQNGNGHINVVKKITIVFGTETGNAKKLATELAAAAKHKGINVKCLGLDQYRFSDLEKEEYFFVVISTQGEGDPPGPAKKFYDALMAKESQLPHLRFAVLALGDTSYPLYCKTGEDVDAQFHKLGGKRQIPLQRCDVDFEKPAHAWFEKVLTITEKGETIDKPVSAPASASPKGEKKIYDGTIITHINLNDRGSDKVTWHIEIAVEEPVQYEHGDAIAIIPHNRKEIVSRIIELTGVDENAVVETSKYKESVKKLLTERLNICYLLTSAIKKYATLTRQDIPDTRMDLVDLLRIYPVKDPSQFIEVLKVLPGIAPRLYSVSSSPLVNPNEVHLTVSRHAYLIEEQKHIGLCSTFLGDLSVDSKLSFYVHRNRSFKLPADDKPVIMIGPGTGIAPFRSFLAERDARGASGQNWFFFGEQHFTTDFLYQTEMQMFLQTGVLNKISLAFSRDQREKVYVQHRMKEQGKELFKWLESGAYVYISGTKDPMSKDVEAALIDIVSTHGNKSHEDSVAYWESVCKDGRFHKDVY